MNLLVLLIAAMALSGGGFVAGWKVEGWRNDSHRAAEVAKANAEAKAAQAAADEARAARERIADRFEQRLANLRIINRTINNEVRHEIEKPVFVDPNCALPESAVRLRNAAIDAANGIAAGQPDAAMPPAPKDAGGGATGAR